MSTPPVYPSAPWGQSPVYNPYTVDPTQVLMSMQNNKLTTDINDSTNRTIGSVSDAQRQLTSEIFGVNKNIFDTIAQNAVAIERTAANGMATTERANNQVSATVERNGYNNTVTTERANNQLATAVERNGYNNTVTTERANNQLASAIERNGFNNASTTERVNSQLASAVERNGFNNAATTERVNNQLSTAVERNGGNILTAIAKESGESRLSNAVNDAASRQAQNDSIRDVLRSVDRVGNESISNIKDAHNGLLGSIERNSGENRVTTLQADIANQTRISDVRRDISTSLNALEGEVLSNINKLSADTIQTIGNTSWETRQNANSNFTTLLSEQQKNSAMTALQSAQQYSTLLLEQHKTAALSDRQTDNHFSDINAKTDRNFATLLLEQQKSSASSDRQHDNQFAAMISKTDNNYASIILEQQKVKECLASQSSQQFAISQLEAQKVKEAITMQLQEAKYEALKNKQELSKELAECCCEVKLKIDQRAQDVISTVDTLDRNRLRDEINTTNNENNLLKFADYGFRGYDYDDDDHRRHRGGRGRHHNHDR